MVKRLIIDDTREFIGGAKGDVMDMARTVDEAEFYLSVGEYDEIWWDYDMGGRSNTSQLARDVASGEQFIRGNPLMVIHTGSPSGRVDLLMTFSDIFEVSEVMT